LHNIEQLSLAVASELPIIVQGGRGSGKSFLIRHIAELLGQAPTLVELHINDQTDTKTLLGSYVCSDIPGEFVWQNGLLTEVVMSGHWLVIENFVR